MKLNYKHLEVLLGTDAHQSKELIHTAMRAKWLDTPSIKEITVHHKCDPSDFYFRRTSNDMNIVEYMIHRCKEYGLSDRMKEQLFDHTHSVLSTTFKNEFSIFYDILNQDCIDEMHESLKRRKDIYLRNGGKVPDNFKKYITDSKIIYQQHNINFES